MNQSHITKKVQSVYKAFGLTKVIFYGNTNEKTHVMKFKSNLLWIDGLGALIAGLIVLIMSAWLSEIYELPKNLLLFIGAVNLVYASYSISLASRSIRPEKLITLLVIANLLWALICFLLAIQSKNTASIFGIIHLVLEGLYVSSLAYLEWRWRHLLQTAK